MINKKYFYLGIIIVGSFGYLIGMLIKYINLFGSSDKAPISCLVGAISFYLIFFYINKNKNGK